MLLLRLPGVFLFRFAARAFLALLFQEPPRFTRFEPAVRPDPPPSSCLIPGPDAIDGCRQRMSTRTKR